MDHRGWLREELRAWPFGVYMLTLTVDPERFESGGQAYDVVTGGRLIARLMGEVGHVKWVSVLELHRREGGWPHWHVLVGSRIDVQAVRAWWTDHAGVCEGGRSTRIHAKYWGDSERAANYSSKYVAKAGEWVPAWVRERGRVRTVSASRSVRSFSSWLKGRQKRMGSRKGFQARVSRRIGERVSLCGCSCVVLKRVSVAARGPESGKASWRYAGRVSMTLRDVRRVADRKGIKYEHRLRHRVVRWSEPRAVLGGMKVEPVERVPYGEWSVCLSQGQWLCLVGVIRERAS